MMTGKFFRKLSPKTALRFAAFAFCCTALIALPSHAQNQDAPPPPPSQDQTTPPPPPPPGGRMRGGDRQLQMMTKRLNLNTDQQTQVKAILKERRSQMQALRADTSTAPEDRRTKMMSIMQESNSKIRALLNEDQQKQFDQMQARMRERMQHRMGGMQPGGNAPPPPPQQ
ncbi:MAG: hypothetical protein ACYC46_02670 [Acidobacteriaceae bacterium]